MTETNEELEWIEMKKIWHALCYKRVEKGKKPKIL